MVAGELRFRFNCGPEGGEALAPTRDDYNRRWWRCAPLAVCTGAARGRVEGTTRRNGYLWSTPRYQKVPPDLESIWGAYGRP